MHIYIDRIRRVVLASCVSTSGKYTLILGEHIVHGILCYDVIAWNKETGVAISRHYKDLDELHLARAEATKVYDEFKQQLTAKAKHSEEEEQQLLEQRLTIISPDKSS